MTTTEPFVPHPDDDDREIAAADPGVGAPAPASGFGVEGEEPDRPEQADTPFRTPTPPEG